MVPPHQKPDPSVRIPNHLPPVLVHQLKPKILNLRPRPKILPNSRCPPLFLLLQPMHRLNPSQMQPQQPSPPKAWLARARPRTRLRAAPTKTVATLSPIVHRLEYTLHQAEALRLVSAVTVRRAKNQSPAPP